MKDMASKLAAHPFLRGLSTARIEVLVPCASETNIEAGGFLLLESQPANATFLITSGRVVLEIYVPTRGAISVESVEAGGIVGWAWVTSPHRGHFDARATVPTHVIVLDGPSLQALCEADPALGYELMKRFMGTLQHRIESLRMQLLDVFGSGAVRR